MTPVTDIWDTVGPPPAPEIKSVVVNPRCCALLILDILNSNCNLERRPRCVESLAGIRKLLNNARSKKIPVVYSLISKATNSDIRQEVVPRHEEKIVKSSVDKFHGTKLAEILQTAKIETVIIVGTAAEGAILHTATGAALRGLNVVVPVDGFSSSDLYSEQYTAWHLVNSPGTKKRTTLTRINMISF